MLCIFKQIRTKNVSWLLVSHTEAQDLLLRVALAVSHGTTLFSSARSTMLGDLMHWSWDWAATASAGRDANGHIMIKLTHIRGSPCMQKDQDNSLHFFFFYQIEIQTVMKAHGVTPSRTCS